MYIDGCGETVDTLSLGLSNFFNCMGSNPITRKIDEWPSGLWQWS